MTDTVTLNHDIGIIQFGISVEFSNDNPCLMLPNIIGIPNDGSINVIIQIYFGLLVHCMQACHYKVPKYWKLHCCLEDTIEYFTSFFVSSL